MRPIAKTAREGRFLFCANDYLSRRVSFSSACNWVNVRPSETATSPRAIPSNINARSCFKSSSAYGLARDFIFDRLYFFIFQSVLQTQ